MQNKRRRRRFWGIANWQVVSRINLTRKIEFNNFNSVDEKTFIVILK